MKFSQIGWTLYGILSVCCLQAMGATEKTHVFFAGGQSNASYDWAMGIQQAISEHLAGQSFQLVWVTHGGQALSTWYMTGPEMHYRTDFFGNSSETPGALQATWAQIIAQGRDPEFSGLFWFQGESDSVMPIDADNYENRFERMIGQLRTDLGLGMNDPLYQSLALIAYAPTTPVDAERWARIEQMRTILRTLGSASDATWFDTAGYTRGYQVPSGDWDYVHILDGERWQVGYDQGQAFFNAFPNVPEPGALGLMTIAGVGLLGVRRRAS